MPTTVHLPLNGVPSCSPAPCAGRVFPNAAHRCPLPYTSERRALNIVSSPCVTTVLGPMSILGNSVTHSQILRPGRDARSGHHSHKATDHVAVHHRKTEQARAPSCSKPNAMQSTTPKKKKSRDTRRTAGELLRTAENNFAEVRCVCVCFQTKKLLTEGQRHTITVLGYQSSAYVLNYRNKQQSSAH